MDSVGDADALHLFRMLVISASAIILRKEVIPWGLGICHQYLKIHLPGLWVTVFRDDE